MIDDRTLAQRAHQRQLEDRYVMIGVGAFGALAFALMLLAFALMLVAVKMVVPLL